LPEFKNESELDFTDISSEQWRRYTWEFGRNVILRSPLWLHVSENGHRVFTADGNSHYVPLGWVHLEWRAKDGAPHFVK
jgi:hypothetical protein